MRRNDSQNLEPRALGRYAFWQGRPITVNPLVGPAAREWAEGWKRGVTELAARLPQDQQDVQALPAAVPYRLLRRHCPSDVPIQLQPMGDRASALRTAHRA